MSSGRGRQAAPTATVAAPTQQVDVARSCQNARSRLLASGVSPSQWMATDLANHGFAKTAEQGTRGAWSLSTRTLQSATGVSSSGTVSAKVLLCWNHIRCRPPLVYEEVVAVVQSIARYADEYTRRWRTSQDVSRQSPPSPLREAGVRRYQCACDAGDEVQELGAIEALRARGPMRFHSNSRVLLGSSSQKRTRRRS